MLSSGSRPERVNLDDLNDDFNSSRPMDDYNTCICPDVIRPYKAKHTIWSLEKAVRFIFNQALDASNTVNTWCCGLDLSLNTWHSNEDKHARQVLITQSLNNIFAPTNLYFYLKQLVHLSQTPTETITLGTIQEIPTPNLPSFLILTDSHGKHLDSFINTSRYNMITKAISGLQWVQRNNSRLCTRSLILTSSISSLLTSCTGVLFLVGTNSVRNTSALTIIDHIEDVINLLRSHHSHLLTKHDISIVTTFPCYKTSNLYPSISTLTNNLLTYNKHLKELSIRLNFSWVDFQINGDHLSNDGLHLDVQHYNT